MSHLQIRLLGPPQVVLGGKAITAMRSDKVRALLGYLSIEFNQPHRREKLAGLLWPDYPEASARASLRRALADMRKVIGDEAAIPHYLHITRQIIQFNPESDVWVDAVNFSQLTRIPAQQNPETIQDWVEAVELYEGEFMEGFSLPDSAIFEEWLLINRERYRRALLETLHHLADTLASRGETKPALKYALRALELDPTREIAHRQAMRLFTLDGQRDAAISQFETCARTLETELGVQPSPETTALYTTIIAGKLGPNDLEIVHPGESLIPPCPYRGLFAFREVDAPFFFGREVFVAQIIQALEHDPLIAVVGPSGSGKSSVVFAGLVPQLRKNEGWEIAHFRPGSDPFQALAAVLLPILEPALRETDRLVETRKLASAFKKGELPMMDVAARILAIKPRSERLLLICDQLEELYTLCPESELQVRFIDLFMDTIQEQALNKETYLHIILTLRADFLGSALMHRPFADALQGADIKLGSMTDDEMRRAIEKPAAIQGVHFEPGLIERILDDVVEEPGYLPLLQFTLTCLWDLQSNGELTHSAYEDIGQVEGALARYADTIMEELDKERQNSARGIFIQLVQPGEGTEDTRRLATKAELGADKWELAQELADARLVVTGKSPEGVETVEVVHEALIQGWGQLQVWIENDRSFRLWQERLRGALRQWEANEMDEGALLRGVPLVEAEGWLLEREGDLSPSEQEYIQISLENRIRRETEQERSRRRIVVGLSVGLVIALILSVFAGLQWWQAGVQREAAVEAQTTAAAGRDQTQSALSRLLAAQSLNLLKEEYDLALLLSVESVHRIETIEGLSSLYTALSNSPNLKTFLHGHQDDVRSVAFHPDGRLLASSDAGGEIILWDTSTGQPLGNPLIGHKGLVNSLVFSPDGNLLASGSFDKSIILWDIDQTSTSFGQPMLNPISGHSGNIWSVAFNPDGSYLASGGADGEIFLWDVGAGFEDYREFNGHDGIISSLAFNPDGHTLASGSSDNTIMLWDVDTGEALAPPLRGHSGFISSVAFSPDGLTLASGSKDNTIRLWDVDTDSKSFGQQVGEPLSGHSDNIWSLVFNPNGKQLASSSEDGAILLWDVDPNSATYRQSLESSLQGHSGAVFALTYSPDGEILASGSADRAVLLWEIFPQNPLARELMKITDTLWWAYFSPDGKRLAWSSPEGKIYIWDMDEASPTFGEALGPPMSGHLDWVNVVIFNPDGKTLASGSDDHSVMLWNVDESSPSYGQQIGAPLLGHEGEVITVRFSPDGKTLATGGEHGDIWIWDVNQDSNSFGQPIGSPIQAHNGIIFHLYFSPDGKILASGGEDGLIQLWDTEAGSESYGQQLTPPLEGAQGYIRLSFSPDGKKLASGHHDGTIKIWNVDRDSDSFGELSSPPLVGHHTWMDGFVYSPDGKYLASGDSTGEILLWDLVDQRSMEISTPGEMVGEGIDVIEMLFSPDGSSLSAVFRDTRVIQWDLDVESWQIRACQRVNRNLTREEWRQFFGEEPYRATCPELPLEVD